MPIFAVPANYAFDNYTDLADAISDWMNRSDLSGSVQTMIALAESEMRRQLSPYMGEKSETIAVASGIGALPTDFGTLRSVIYDGRALDNVSSVGATNIPTGLAKPYAYSIEAGSIKLWPAVDATVTLLYQPQIPFLTPETPTNVILSNHPDVYFFGAMLYAEGYVANDQRAVRFGALFQGALDSVKQYLTRQRYGGPLVPRVSFVP